MTSTLRLIDTHHHIIPPSYLARERDRVLGAVAPPLAQRLQAWTPAQSIETMDKHGIATSVTSISTPGVWFDDVEKSRLIARDCNDYAAEMRRDHKGRFGLFAALPLPDVAGSLKEIEYAFDVLKADGIGLMTNYHDKYPGDPAFAPVFQELNRRKAIVYFHPTATDCCSNLVPGLGAATVEFPQDTTRAIVSLLFGGTLTSCPDIRWIFSHGGGTLGVLTQRIGGVLRARKDLAAKLPNGVLPELRKLYYDVVGAANPVAFPSVKALAGMSQLLFGTDFPYWDVELTLDPLKGLGLDDGDMQAIARGNALRLMPQLGG